MSVPKTSQVCFIDISSDGEDEHVNQNHAILSTSSTTTVVKMENKPVFTIKSDPSSLRVDNDDNDGFSIVKVVEPSSLPVEHSVIKQETRSNDDDDNGIFITKVVKASPRPSLGQVKQEQNPVSESTSILDCMDIVPPPSPPLPPPAPSLIVKQQQQQEQEQELDGGRDEESTPPVVKQEGGIGGYIYSFVCNLFNVKQEGGEKEAATMEKKGNLSSSDDNSDIDDYIDQLSNIDDNTKSLLKKERKLLEEFKRAGDDLSTHAESVPFLHTLIADNSMVGLELFNSLTVLHDEWKEYIVNILKKRQTSPLRLHFLQAIGWRYIKLLMPPIVEMSIESFIDAVRIKNIDIINYWKSQLASIDKERYLTSKFQRTLLFLLVKDAIIIDNNSDEHNGTVSENSATMQLLYIVVHVLGYPRTGLATNWFPMSKSECFYYLNMYVYLCGYETILAEISRGLWITYFDVDTLNIDHLNCTPSNGMPLDDFMKGISELPLVGSNLQRIEQDGLFVKETIVALLKYGSNHDIILAYYDTICGADRSAKVNNMTLVVNWLFEELLHQHAIYLKYVNENLIAILRELSAKAPFYNWSSIFETYTMVYWGFFQDVYKANNGNISEIDFKSPEMKKKKRAANDFFRSLLDIYYDPHIIGRYINPLTLMRANMVKFTENMDKRLLESLGNVFHAHVTTFKRRANEEEEMRNMGSVSPDLIRPIKRQRCE